MSLKKPTSIAFAAAAVIACLGAYSASASSRFAKPRLTSASRPAPRASVARPDTDTVVAGAAAAKTVRKHPTPPVLDSLIKGTLPVRGLYVYRFGANPRRMKHLIGIADSTEINAFVIDVKDEFGLNFNSTDPMVKKNAGTQVKATHMAEVVDSIRAHGILPIARIVVFKDSVTARVHPEWTIRRKDGSTWRDKKGIAWVNPYHRELWDYNIGVAEELVKLGFKEIQFDYIRFPEPYPSLPPQVFPGANDVSKADALAAYLKEAKSRLNKLGVRSTADIFGLVTTVGGPLEVGQYWEKISPNVDVVLPMVYPSHYPHGELGVANPNAQPYEIIYKAISRARERDKKLGIQEPEHVRPWLQAFTLGKPEYGPTQLEAEKKAVYDAGYDGWVMWNPGSIYDVYMPALEKTFVSRKKTS
jgi:hypothetical protein